MRYVIIGNGMAGVSAASKIRENDARGHIDIISREDNTFYSRPMLQRFLSGESAVEEIILHDMEWYKKNNLSLVMGEDVGEIDADRKEVKTLSGHVYSYDKLLVASGGYCFVPPIKGMDKAGIFTLSCIADARKIKEYARESKTAVIIGAGPIGLETAAALTKLKLKVTIIEALPRLLPRQLDTAAAGLMKKELEEKFGFSFFLNSQCQEITGNGKATGVLLATGQVIPGDLIIVSAGIRPKLDLAKAIGLKTERGIAVDEHMETSRSGIYAAGDVAEFNGMVYGLWPAAQQQGEVAGVNMAGGKQEYGGTVPSNALSILGINVMSAGDIDVEGKHQGLVKEDKANYTYRKYVVSNDILIGTVLLNDIRGGGEIMGAIRQKKNVLPYKDAILQDSFDFKSLS